MTDHLSWQTLNDWVDDALSPDARSAAERHFSACEPCAAQLDVLRAALRDAATLPQGIAVPPELWGRVQATIEARKVTPLPGAHAGNAVPAWLTPRRLAAAAVGLIVISSAATVLVLRDPGGRIAATGAAIGTSLARASWEASERGYLATAEELRSQLDAQRGTLAPETVATVERLLGTVDAAIAEARSELLRDPANAALAELLASNYRQKIELLRRATQLTPAT